MRIYFLNIYLLFSVCLPTFAQQTAGLFLSDTSTQNGYVLFSNNTETYLIDNCGLIVNQWSSDYKPGAATYLLPDGNLLRTAAIESDFGLGGTGGRGGRLELFFWTHELLWSAELANEYLHLHHDIEPLPNGNILVVAWEKHSEQEAKALGRIADGEVWSERILELQGVDNQGFEIVWEWRVWDHLVQDVDVNLPNFGNINTHSKKININYQDADQNPPENWMHINSIDYNETTDEILLSSRLFSEIWIINHNLTTAEAATNKGDLLFRCGNPKTYASSDAQFLKYQHDAHWIAEDLPNGGQIMVFNNEKESNKSTVEIIKPKHDAVGNYLNDAEIIETIETPNFYSKYMSSAQQMPNGNVFVCEGSTGRFFEISPQNKIVWEYINPVNSNGGPAIQGGQVRFNQTFHATKYMPDYTAFIGKNMEGTVPVELNPWDSDCFIKIETPTVGTSVEVVENPVKNKLNVSIVSDSEVQLKMYNLTGQLALEKALSSDETEVDISFLNSGLYFLVFEDENGFSQIKKVIKL